jgi:hypothetical protein
MTDDDTTRIIPRKSSSADETRPLGGKLSGFGSNDDDPHTRIYRPKTAPASDSTSGTVEVNATGFSAEPVVGWLVVIDGPGRGQSLKLGYGVNTIGRGPDARVSLDFGDEEISRSGHAMLTYDTKGRKFYIQHGGAANLTYLGDVPVLQPHEIKGREIIGIGNTRLIFVPFCGPDFEW